MKTINWKSIYGEILSVSAYVLYFETPSLQAWAGHHPDTKLAAVIAVLVAMGMKPSSVKSATPEAK